MVKINFNNAGNNNRGSNRGSINCNNHGKHPIFHQRLSLGEKAADLFSEFVGSWTFIVLFLIVVLVWISVNAFFLLKKPFDPYPFILLNLALSCLAALQAPVILMSQNREAQRDRQYARYDYQVNRKAEREIICVQKDLKVIKKKLGV